MSTPTMTNAIELTGTTEVTKKGPKTLPMKPKTMQCGIVGFLKKMELEGFLEAGVCETLLTKLPLFGTVEEQVSYYDGNYDIKHIEQTYIKPRIQEHKKANKPQKEKKPRQKKAKVETTVTVEKTPEKTNKVEEIPEKPVKKPRTKKADGEKKPRGRKAKETDVEFARDEDDETSDATRNLMSDLEAEKYVETSVVETSVTKVEEKPVEEKPKKKRVAKKKVEEKPNVESEKVEHWLISRNGTRYWTTDENEQNGDVYSYDGKDEDGDPAPNKKVGKLVNGELQLD